MSEARKGWSIFFWAMNVTWAVLAFGSIVADLPNEEQHHAIQMWVMTLIAAVLLSTREAQS